MKILRLEWQKIFSRRNVQFLFLAVLLLTGLYLRVLMVPEEVVIESQKEAAKKIIQRFDGPFNLQNHQAFQALGHKYSVAKREMVEKQELLYSSRITRSQFLEQTLGPQSFLATEPVYNYLLKNVIYLLSDPDLKRHLIYPNGWHYFFNSHKIYYPLLFLLQWLASSIFLSERESQMKPIIRSTIRGREKVSDAKLSLIFILTSCFIVLIFLLRLAIASFYYGIDHFGAVASSLSRFMSMPSSMSLLRLLLLTLFSQLIAYTSYAFMLACVAESSGSAALSFFSGLALILLGNWQRGQIGILTQLLPTTLMETWLFEWPGHAPGYLATIGLTVMIQLLLIFLMIFYLRRRYRSTYSHSRKHKFLCSPLAICLVLICLASGVSACGTGERADHQRYMTKEGYINHRERLIIPHPSELKYLTLTEFKVSGKPPHFHQTDLIRDPFATGSQRRLDRFISVEDDKVYYQVYHLKEVFDEDYYIYNLLNSAIEIRELDLDTYEDKRYLYMQLDGRLRDLFFSQNGLYVSSGKVYIIFLNSVHELTEWGLREKMTIPEMKQIDMIHNDLIYGPNYANNLLVANLKDGSVKSYEEVFFRGPIFIFANDIIFQDDISHDIMIRNLETGTERVILNSEDHPGLSLYNLYRGRIVFRQDSQRTLRFDFYSCDLNGEQISLLAEEKEFQDAVIPVGSGYFIGQLLGAGDLPPFYLDSMLEED